MLWGCAGNGMAETSRPHREDQVQGQRLVYSNRCGRVVLDNVTVQNRGVDWAHAGNIYWQHMVSVQLGMTWQSVIWFYACGGVSHEVLSEGACDAQCMYMHRRSRILACICNTLPGLASCPGQPTLCILFAELGSHSCWQGVQLRSTAYCACNCFPTLEGNSRHIDDAVLPG